MNSLIHISHKGKGKGPRAQREKGKPGARHLRCISTLHSPRARTHDTKRFPGYGGACLKANSLPPTSDTYTCTDTYTYTYTDTYTYTYTYSYTGTYTHTHTHIQMRTHIHAYIINIHLHICIYMYIYTYTCVYIYIYIYIHIYIGICICICIDIDIDIHIHIYIYMTPARDPKLGFCLLSWRRNAAGGITGKQTLVRRHG